MRGYKFAPSIPWGKQARWARPTTGNPGGRCPPYRYEAMALSVRAAHSTA